MLLFVWFTVEDKNIAWHCGAKTYFHPECRNSNSIGIELCSYIDKGNKYSFKEQTIENAVWLVKQLMQKYNIPVSHILRHYDVTRKICPEPFVRDIKAWEAFKSKLTEVVREETVTETNINVNGRHIKINRILKNGKNYIDLRGLEQAGFKVSYNASTKLLSLNNSVNDTAIEVNGSNRQIGAVNLNGINYVPIRAMSELTGAFDVDYKDNKVIIKTK